MPGSVSELGAWAVTFTLSDAGAAADFTGGATHDFAAGDLRITVTAEDGSEKTYTVVVALDAGGSGDDDPTGVASNVLSPLKYAGGLIINPTGGEVSIYSISGALVLRSSKDRIEVQSLQLGLYLAQPQKGATLKFVNY